VKVETARAKLRAEGVLLMVAARHGVDAVEVVPSSERKAVSPSSNEQLVTDTIAGLSGDLRERSHGRAATAARLAIR
jgi:hypothetical protein